VCVFECVSGDGAYVSECVSILHPGPRRNITMSVYACVRVCVCVGCVCVGCTCVGCA